MKKRSLYVINEYFEEILCLKVAIIADSLQGHERLRNIQWRDKATISFKDC